MVPTFFLHWSATEYQEYSQEGGRRQAHVDCMHASHVITCEMPGTEGEASEVDQVMEQSQAWNAIIENSAALQPAALM